MEYDRDKTEVPYLKATTITLPQSVISDLFGASGHLLTERESSLLGGRSEQTIIIKNER